MRKIPGGGTLVLAACCAAMSIQAARGQAHHSHAALGIAPSSAAPSLEVEVRPEAGGGWNVHLVTRNFTFAPEHVNGPAIANEGHAHIYVDGHKTRIYGPWAHIDPLAPGPHRLRVTLNANSHEELAVGGHVIEAVRDFTQPAPEAEPKAFAIALVGSAVQAPPVMRVTRGEEVVLRVRSDHDDELHIHGYDKRIAVAAGRESVLRFVTDRTGRFPIESHRSHAEIGALEVYPR